MRVTRRSSEDVEVIAPEGKLDALSSQVLKQHLDEMMDKGQIEVVMNFERVDYISSSGLRVILTALKRMRNGGGDLKLASLDSNVREIFEIAGFTELFEIYQGEEEAVQNFKKTQ